MSFHVFVFHSGSRDSKCLLVHCQWNVRKTDVHQKKGGKEENKEERKFRVNCCTRNSLRVYVYLCRKKVL